MMKTIDARGRSCPEPVMMTRAALQESAEGVTMLVDNICAVENITRYAAHEGYEVTREDGADDYALTLAKK